MSLRDILVQGVAIVDNVTAPLQATVGFRHLVSTDGEGVKTYLPALDQPPAQLQATVDWKQKHLRTAEGNLTVSRAAVMFLDPAALALATNNEGVDDNDIIILPDGTTGPILDMVGFIDSVTTHPFATEVFLG